MRYVLWAMANASQKLASIVIPTRDRPDQLERCLRSLTRLETPRAGFEVIVVDDGSDPPVAPVVERFESELDVVCVRQAESRGPAAARNSGAARARGMLLAFTDDDCIATPGWLEELVEALDGSRGDESVMVGGRIENALVENAFSDASQLLIDYLYHWEHEPEGGREGDQDDAFFCSNNLAVRRDAFRALEGFDETFPQAAGEDRELCDRWVRAGGRLAYQPAAVVRHAHRLGPVGFWRQHFRYGRAARHFQRVRARRGAGPVRVRAPAFYLGMLRYPFGRRERGAWRSALLLASAQLANAAGFAAEALRESQ